MISATSSRCVNSFISSRIWAWIVTSSAVVGSSAMISFGSHVSAIAIMMRCRIPSESFCRFHLLLKDNADFAAAHLPDPLPRQAQQVAAGKDYLALGDPPGRIGDQA